MAHLDQALLKKMAVESGKTLQAQREQISRKASREGISSEAAQIVIARELGLGTSLAFRKLPPHIQNETRSNGSAPIVVKAPIERRTRTTRKSASKGRRRGNSVFVVHGRDSNARIAMFAFLRSLGLNPIEWNKALSMTKQGSPYVGTVLDAAFEAAVAIVVLLTPDDEARLKKTFHGAKEPAHEKKLVGQARPNVLFEAGMAFGKNPGSTVLVQLGEIRPFSDVGGRHVVHLTNKPESRQELATKLANAGCNVDTAGTDWYSAGDFSIIE